MSEWMPIETAPRDGTVFLAVNHDREVWPTKFIDNRIAYRMNGRYEPRKFAVRYIDGVKHLIEDEDFAAKNECWQSNWTFWSRLYEFTPTHWLPLPVPPK